MKQDLDTAFARYLQENPQIWEFFCRFAEQARQAGRKHIGAKAIMERIRWETYLAPVQEPGFPLLKVNNNYSSRLARKLMAERPEFAGCFELRELKSGCPSAACEQPLSRHDDGECPADVELL